MRKQRFPLLLVAVLLAFSTFAQHPCGFDPLYLQLQQEIPGFSVDPQQLSQQAATRDDEIFVVPVVVHVVWKEEVENISEERIRSQIAVLNRDFRGANADLGQVRPEFSGIVGDARIEFQLEEIIRVQTDSIFAVTTDWETRSIRYPEGIKAEEQGGSTAWDPQYFLNIWVAAIADDLVFGYTYPPSGLNTWSEGAAAPSFAYDGIVINYKAFGASPPPYLTQSGESISLSGRTLVHELGHYLGLLHPWGNFELDQNGCDFDDGIADTPPSATSSFFDCDFQQNTCAGSNDLPDMIENFMDFSMDDCRVSFTQEQINVMRGVLENQRRDLRLLDKNERFENELILYPNPSPGQVRIYLRKEIKTDYQLRLRTVDRRVIAIPFTQTEAFPGVSFSFDIGHLSDGVYFVELETDQWRFVEQLVLIK